MKTKLWLAVLDSSTLKPSSTWSFSLSLIIAGLISLAHSGPINRQAGINENVYITVQNDTFGNEQRVCSIDSMTYEDGESIPTSSNCEHCICRPPGFACTIISCEYRPGCKAIKRSSQCCPEYQCECEKDGKIYQNGEKILDDNNPCEVCYCQGGDVICAVIDCYWRSDCQPRYIENRCCPLYDHCPPPSDVGPVRPTHRPSTTTTGSFNWFNISQTTQAPVIESSTSTLSTTTFTQLVPVENELQHLEHQNIVEFPPNPNPESVIVPDMILEEINLNQPGQSLGGVDKEFVHAVPGEFENNEQVPGPDEHPKPEVSVLPNEPNPVDIQNLEEPQPNVPSPESQVSSSESSNPQANVPPESIPHPPEISQPENTVEDIMHPNVEVAQVQQENNGVGNSVQSPAQLPVEVEGEQTLQHLPIQNHVPSESSPNNAVSQEVEHPNANPIMQQSPPPQQTPISLEPSQVSSSLAPNNITNYPDSPVYQIQRIPAVPPKVPDVNSTDQAVAPSVEISPSEPVQLQHTVPVQVIHVPVSVQEDEDPSQPTIHIVAPVSDGVTPDIFVLMPSAEPTQVSDSDLQAPYTSTPSFVDALVTETISSSSLSSIDHSYEVTSTDSVLPTTTFMSFKPSVVVVPQEEPDVTTPTPTVEVEADPTNPPESLNANILPNKDEVVPNNLDDQGSTSSPVDLTTEQTTEKSEEPSSIVFDDLASSQVFQAEVDQSVTDLPPTTPPLHTKIGDPHSQDAHDPSDPEELPQINEQPIFVDKEDQPISFSVNVQDNNSESSTETSMTTAPPESPSPGVDPKEPDVHESEDAFDDASTNPTTSEDLTPQLVHNQINLIPKPGLIPEGAEMSYSVPQQDPQEYFEPSSIILLPTKYNSNQHEVGSSVHLKPDDKPQNDESVPESPLNDGIDTESVAFDQPVLVIQPEGTSGNEPIILVNIDTGSTEIANEIQKPNLLDSQQNINKPTPLSENLNEAGPDAPSLQSHAQGDQGIKSSQIDHVQSSNDKLDDPTPTEQIVGVTNEPSFMNDVVGGSGSEATEIVMSDFIEHLQDSQDNSSDESFLPTTVATQLKPNELTLDEELNANLVFNHEKPLDDDGTKVEQTTVEANNDEVLQDETFHEVYEPEAPATLPSNLPEDVNTESEQEKHVLFSDPAQYHVGDLTLSNSELLDSPKVTQEETEAVNDALAEAEQYMSQTTSDPSEGQSGVTSEPQRKFRIDLDPNFEMVQNDGQIIETVVQESTPLVNFDDPQGESSTPPSSPSQKFLLDDNLGNDGNSNEVNTTPKKEDIGGLYEVEFVQMLSDADETDIASTLTPNKDSNFKEDMDVENESGTEKSYLDLTTILPQNENETKIVKGATYAVIGQLQSHSKSDIPIDLVKQSEPFSDDLDKSDGRSDLSIQAEAEDELASTNANWFWRTINRIRSLPLLLSPHEPLQEPTSSHRQPRSTFEGKKHVAKPKLGPKQIKRSKSNKPSVVVPRFLFW